MDGQLEGRTVLITGANGGLGTQFVVQALERGARRVYATARSPRSWGNDDRIVGLELDVTDDVSVRSAAEVAGDVDLLVNNAGISPPGDTTVLDADDRLLRQVFDTNFHGSLRTAKAFAPALKAHRGSMLNVLSAAAWTPMPTTYAASKAAMWSATSALRTELAADGVTVTALFAGLIDTPMTAHLEMPKVSAASVVAQAYDGVAAGVFEVLADPGTRRLKAALGRTAEDVDALMATALDDFMRQTHGGDR